MFTLFLSVIKTFKRHQTFNHRVFEKNYQRYMTPFKCQADASHITIFL